MSTSVFCFWSLTSLSILISSYDPKIRTKIPKSLQLSTLFNLRLDSATILFDKSDPCQSFSQVVRVKHFMH